jgi:rod shape-determining protein MreD
MKKRIFFLIILACCLLQATLLNSFRFFWVKPDLLLVCVVIASLSFDLKWALTYSVFAGFFKDIFGPHMFGINILLFPLWAVLIKRLARDISFDNLLLKVILMCVVTFTHNIANGLIIVYLGNYIPLGIFTRIVVIESLYTALCLPLVLKIIQPADL